MAVTAETKENKLEWAIKTAQKEYPKDNWTRPLEWVKREGYVKGSNTRKWAWEAAMRADFDKALKTLKE